MQYTNLGRTGLRVSRIVLGTMNFGWQLDEADSHAILDRSYDEAINLVDTANMYGRVDYDGTSEQYIGSWFDKTGRRDQIVLATKVYAPMSDWPNDRGLSARHIIAACEASLRRLRTDWIEWPSRGCCPVRVSPRRSSARGRRRNSTSRCAPCPPRCPRTPSRSWTSCSRRSAPAAPPRRRGPGNPESIKEVHARESDNSRRALP